MDRSVVLALRGFFGWLMRQHHMLLGNLEAKKPQAYFQLNKIKTAVPCYCLLPRCARAHRCGCCQQARTTTLRFGFDLLSFRAMTPLSPCSCLPRIFDCCKHLLHTMSSLPEGSITSFHNHAAFRRRPSPSWLRTAWLQERGRRSHPLRRRPRSMLSTVPV